MHYQFPLIFYNWQIPAGDGHVTRAGQRVPRKAAPRTASKIRAVSNQRITATNSTNCSTAAGRALVQPAFVYQFSMRRS